MKTAAPTALAARLYQRGDVGGEVSICIDAVDKILQLHPAARGDILQSRQNASSRLTLVLCPLSSTECLTTDDFMAPVLL